MDKIVGLDLGTNSIGLVLRYLNGEIDISEQMKLFGVTLFPSGVGKSKSGEFSFAAERTKKRTVRRMYQARKYRIWATLELLINNGYCPLTIEDLNKWRRYDLSKGLRREYPVNAVKFNQWVCLDFNGDGIADYSSPYELRNELMTVQYDFSDETDRFKFGRAIYHIAQRRGFKSSKGETIEAKDDKEVQESDDVADTMKKSEENKSADLTKYMAANNLPTVGCAFYSLLQNGIRVRNSDFQAVRSQYKDEIKSIFEFQKGLDSSSDFYKHLISEKKNEGTIFYKRPLRSQKGLVGKCTLEPTKDRCAVSHPDFEKFRAWCFINSIKFGKDNSETLTIEQKQRLYEDRFLLTKRDFKFEEIRKWIEKETHKQLSYNQKTINYKDITNVAACPVSGRLKNLLGVNWRSWKYKSDETKVNKKTGEVKSISYDVFDLWHVCFSFEDSEFVEEFARKKLNFDTNQTKQLVRIFGAIQQGYGMLSLKAVRSITRFLEKGYIYTDAVLLAKLPELFGEDKWLTMEDDVLPLLHHVIDENKRLKSIYNVVNTLIADYKSLEADEQFARKNTRYILSDDDKKSVVEKALKNFGEYNWNSKTEDEKNEILSLSEKLYQDFFASEDRDYYKLPKLADAFASIIKEKYDFVDNSRLKKIYHPSMIEIYSPAKDITTQDGRIVKHLGSPVIGALKNPMAMRVLHSLRHVINSLLSRTDEYGNCIIDENTKVVVETARELNDANMRWAIEEYQREREKENKEFEKLIEEYYPGRTIKDDDINAVRLMVEQHEPKPEKKEEQSDKQKFERFKKDVTKYRLWAEQGCRCIYTGKFINITNLFDDNAFDIEHTIPRSKSFDDSLENLTVCDAHFNRAVKKNRIPSQLDNYQDILERIKPWKDKVERLNANVEFWKWRSKKAATKDSKDKCIRQRHLWQMELDYWKKKVERFEMKEITTGFRNSQLVDTRIITKYAYHYLKTVLNRVEVQKGNVTAVFRKMLGIQNVDEKKSRERHSHHAIDAAMLTLIPTAVQRDKMLELFYSIQENKKSGKDVSILERQLTLEMRKCGLNGNIKELVPAIENSILIQHSSKDQVLSPAHRRKRVRGKIVPKTDDAGNVLFEQNDDGTFKLDVNGHKIPQAKYWLAGDCVRGQIHEESFYGAIRLGKIDDNGKTLRRDADGKIIQGDTVYVIRRELKFKKNDLEGGFKNWDELEKVIVDKALFKKIKSQFPEGTSFKDAFAEGGVKDHNGNTIRHVRCFVPSVKNPLKIKRQTYLSKYDYKQY
ncbi:MAG: hypothetical protein K6F33_02190, partial [Bacteroidales bacterium]|nr:hypothetical protein [Bacteroidales bacterium]